MEKLLVDYPSMSLKAHQGSIPLMLSLLLSRHMEVDKEVSAHEQLHLRPVTCVDISFDGELVVTGLIP